MSELRETTRRLAQAIRRSAATGDASIEGVSAAAFRAIVAERLRSLEREVSEVRLRINGLLFVVAGAVITQVVLRLAG